MRFFFCFFCWTFFFPHLFRSFTWKGMKRNRPRGSFWLGVPVALPCASDALGSGSILPRVYICHIPIVRRDNCAAVIPFLLTTGD